VGPEKFTGNAGRVPADCLAVQGSEEPEGPCLSFVLAFFCCAAHGHVQTVFTRASGSRKMLTGFLVKLNQSADFDQLVWSNSAKDVKRGLLCWQLRQTVT